MGIAPLDWADSMPWKKPLRVLGEGSEKARAMVKPRGIINFNMPPSIPKDTATIVKIILEHDFISSGNKAPDVNPNQSAAGVWIDWMRGGAQIFDFDAELIAELADTDVSDVPVTEIQFPYNVFYLNFNGEIKDDLGQALEGILIERRDVEALISNDPSVETIPASVILGFTPFRRQGNSVIVDEAGYMSLKEDVTVVEAIDNQINKTSNPDTMITLLGDEKVPSFGVKGPMRPEHVKQMKQNYEGMHESAKRIKSILPLIVNSLLYIDGCRSHIKRGWPKGASEKLASAALAVSGETRAKTTLHNNNWREVHRCTLDAEQEAGNVSGERLTNEDRNRPRAHYRRAHWRLQPYGPGNNLRKRIRIRAMLISTGASVQKGPHSYKLKNAA